MALSVRSCYFALSITGENMNGKLAFGLVAMLVVCGSSIGCTQISQLSDDDLAAYVNVGAEKSVVYGLKFAARKYPEKAAAIQKDAIVVAGVIDDTVMKMLNGTASDVLRSTVGQISQLLTSKIASLPSGEALADTVKLTVDIVALNIKLPKNPADKIDERTKGALIAFFKGVSTGAKTAFAAPVPGAPAAGITWPEKP
jgi:hypothetical protein